MTDLGTPTPDLNLVNNACKVLEDEGLDVHTITIVLSNGRWRVRVESTNEELEEVTREFLIGNGSHIESE